MSWNGYEQFVCPIVYVVSTRRIRCFGWAYCGGEWRRKKKKEKRRWERKLKVVSLAIYLCRSNFEFSWISFSSHVQLRRGCSHLRYSLYLSRIFPVFQQSDMCKRNAFVCSFEFLIPFSYISRRGCSSTQWQRCSWTFVAYQARRGCAEIPVVWVDLGNACNIIKMDNLIQNSY